MDITLTIQFNPQTREVRVTGPITDKILCYGLLEMARETVQMQATLPQSPLAIPKLNVINGSS